MAVPWPVTVLVTAVLTLLGSLCIYTQFEFTLKVPVKTTAENVFRFLSNPMVIKDLHPLVVSLKISSQQQMMDPPGEYFDVAMVENIPLLGQHAFRNQIWTNKETLTIKNMGHPIWALMTTNVTWTVVSEGDPDTERCFIQERAVTSLPWLLSSYVKAIEEETHRDLLKKAQQTIEHLSMNRGRKPGSTHQHKEL